MNRHFLIKQFREEYIWWSLFLALFGFSFFVPEELKARYLTLQILVASAYIAVIITQYTINTNENKLLSNQYQRALPIPWIYSYLTILVRVAIVAIPSGLFMIQAKLYGIPWLNKYHFLELIVAPIVTSIMFLSMTLNFRLQIQKLQKAQNIKKKKWAETLVTFELIGLFMIAYTLVVFSFVIESGTVVILSYATLAFVLAYNNYKWWVNRRTFLSAPVKVVSLTYFTAIVSTLLIVSFMDLKIIKNISGKELVAENSSRELSELQYKGVDFPTGSYLTKTDLDDQVRISTAMSHKGVSFPKDSVFNFFKDKLASVETIEAFRYSNFTVPPGSRFFGGESHFSRIYITQYFVFGEFIFNNPIKLKLESGKVEAVELTEDQIVQGHSLPKGTLLYFDNRARLTEVHLSEDLLLEGKTYKRNKVFKVENGQIVKLIPGAI